MLTLTRAEEKIRDERDKWMRDHRGVLARIAEHLGVSHGKVRLTYMGAIRCPDPDVVHALAAAGAPGFVDVNTETAA